MNVQVTFCVQEEYSHCSCVNLVIIWNHKFPQKFDDHKILCSKYKFGSFLAVTDFRKSVNVKSALSHLARYYMFKVNNINTRKSCKICSKYVLYY